MPWLFTDAGAGNLATHVGDDVASVADRRESLSIRLGRPVRWMQQVHGDTVAVVGAERMADGACDALVTQDQGVALGVLVADCIPLLLNGESCVAAVHVGRRGLVNEVAVKTVALMRSLGARDISAILGPSICGSCYEVPQAMHDEVVALWPAASARTRIGTPALDLPAGLVEQLQAVNVSAIRDLRCTREDDDLYSYRRDPDCGRMAGVIWRE